jgi:hypothetical protein
MYDLTLRRQVLQCFSALTDRFDQNPSSLDEVAQRRRVEHDPGSAALQTARTALEDVHLMTCVTEPERRGYAADRSAGYGDA